jgi:hypothetical protein
MASKILLVQNDSKPRLIFNVVDQNNNNAPFDLSQCSSVVFQFYQAPTTIIATGPCTLMAGYIDQYGNTITTPPYNVPGAGGRCYIDWLTLQSGGVAVDALINPGEYLGVLQLFYADSSRQTIYQPQKFSVRAEA